MHDIVGITFRTMETLTANLYPFSSPTNTAGVCSATVYRSFISVDAHIAVVNVFIIVIVFRVDGPLEPVNYVIIPNNIDSIDQMLFQQNCRALAAIFTTIFYLKFWTRYLETLQILPVRQHCYF